METRTLKCNSCGGTMELSEDQTVICCPYCGSKELIIESEKMRAIRSVSKSILDARAQKFEHEEKMNEVSDNQIKMQKEELKRTLLIIAFGVLSPIILCILCKLCFNY